jgi:hypothetical protein
MKFKTSLIAAILLLPIASVQAALVESDWKSTGDALATLDTETGIEWLDLTQTDDISIAQAKGMLSNSFLGWRLPTLPEVTAMMESAFSSEVSRVNTGGNFSSYADTTNNEADLFRSLFGVTRTGGSYQFTAGIVENDPGKSTKVLQSGVRARTSDNYLIISSKSNYTDNLNSSSSSFGVYLVSDGGTTLSSQQDPSINSNNANAPAADVSAPALLGLMSLGLFGFAARRRSLF